jgi:DNA-binding beta-propeller fold protein YncE
MTWRVRALGGGRLLTWIGGIASFGLLAYLLAAVAYQMAVPPPPHRILFVQDIPLPSGLGPASPGQTNPLAPGPSVDFDHFDFQALDPQTHKLFIAHTGPNPDLMTLAGTKFDPKTDGHVLVFDTQQDRLVGRIDIPQVAGIVLAPDLHKVYAADAEENIVYAIDEQTLKPTAIALDDNESPDAIAYDPVDHRIFVSDPGAPADPDKTLNVDPDHQNIVVIDALEDEVIAKVNIGKLPKLPDEKAPTLPDKDSPTFGYDIGHNKYDENLHRVFVTTQILPDADDPNPALLPPPGTGELMAIDPITAEVVQRLLLPATCSTPHGMALDTQQEVAFIACGDFDADRQLLANLVRVDLKAMRVIAADPANSRLAPGPDIVVLDHPYHVLFVACKGGISVFDEKAGAFHKLGDYHIGKQTHTIALDEATQMLYLPMDSGGRPVLRIARYNPSGV